MEHVLAWILSFMVSVAPPGRKTFYVEAQETQEEALARYQSIAEDIVYVVYDPNTKVLFRGANGRSRTVSVVLSIMLHESGFMKNVDYGIGKYARGDKGRSWCLMQLNIGAGKTWSWNVKYNRRPRWGDNPSDIVDGYTGPELVKDRRLCIQEGLKVLRMSFSACRGVPLNQKLRAYASGSCSNGQQQSAMRMNTAIRWFQNSRDKRKLFKDSDVVTLIDSQLYGKTASERVAAEKNPSDDRTAKMP